MSSLIEISKVVIKRNGYKEKYDQSKIEKTLNNLFAFHKTEDGDRVAISVANYVTLQISVKYDHYSTINVSVIRTEIERALMKFDLYYELRDFILSGYKL